MCCETLHECESKPYNNMYLTYVLMYVRVGELHVLSRLHLPLAQRRRPQ